MKTLSYLILAIFFMPFVSDAQSSDAFVWVNGGLGFNFNEIQDETHLSYGAKLFLNRGEQLYAIHYAIGQIPVSNSNYDVFTEVAFLGGWITKENNNHFYALTGLSFLNGVTGTSNVETPFEEKEQLIGWPIEFGYTHYVNKHLGFSVSYFGNFTKDNYLDGLRLTFTVGQF